MAIEILSKPYPTGGNKINPGYNPLHFVVNSTQVKRQNYKYIADIYIGTTLIATLKHHPDLLTKYGIFDAGKILENVLSYDTSKLFVNGFSGIGGSITDYNIKFGEEYSRVYKFTSLSSASGNMKVFTDVQHNLRVGDFVYLEFDNKAPVYISTKDKQYFQVIAKTTTSFTLNTAAVSGQNTGYFTECEKVSGVRTWTDKNGTVKMGYLIHPTTPTRINVGDTVIFDLYSSVNPAYEVSQTVENITTRTESSIAYQFIQTSCIAPTNYTQPLSSNSILYSLNNYAFKNVTTTTADKSYTFNGALQYDEFLDWNQTDYMMTNSNSKFLTHKPLTKIIKPNTNETLSVFKNFVSNEFNKVKFRMYTKSNVIGASINNSGATMVAEPTGNYTAYFKVGDNINIVSNGITYNTTITSVNYIALAGKTYIVTAQSSVGSTNIGSIDLVWRENTVNYPTDYAYTVYRRIDLQVGTKYVESFTNYPVQEVTKYTVILYKDTTIASQTHTFTIDNSCQEWETYRFVYLNLLGGWDWFEFNGKPLEGITIEKDNYNRKLESMIGNNYTYTMGDRGITTYNVNASDVITTYTGFINIETANWLNELYTSPEVYIVKGTELYPIIITNAEYAKPQINKLGLINLPVTFRFSFDRNIQRGGGIGVPVGSIFNPNVPDTAREPYQPWLGWTYIKSLYE